MENETEYDKNGDDAQVTIGPWNWEWMMTNDQTQLLNKMQLAVIGNIACWHQNINKINYTMSHHCETDEQRDWEQLKGRLVQWTGQPGGNFHGTSVSNWKHGDYQHALSKVALCET